jgi:hypothetical protein
MDEMKCVPAPPIGIMPRKYWVEQRKNDLLAAIKRYMDAEKDIPQEWIHEYVEHSNWLWENQQIKDVL